MKKLATVLLLALALLGCGAKDAGDQATKRYPMQGTVLALDSASKTATIAAGKIGDWMDAMTMAYPVKPDAEFEKLRTGDQIDATVVVADTTYYVTEVKVTRKK